jgi:short subunit dehydrogenase-like uncharacterized protein
MFDSLSGAELKQMGNPYLLNPEGTRGPDGRDLAGMTFDRNAGWICPFVMAASNTRLVRRSLALMQRPEVSYNEVSHEFFAPSLYPVRNIISGDARWEGVWCFLQRIRYKTMRANKEKEKDCFCTHCCYLSPTGVVLGFPLIALLIFFRCTRRCLWWMLSLPKPGQGPSRESRENGFFNSHFLATTKSGQKNWGLVADAHRDPGYVRVHPTHNAHASHAPMHGLHQHHTPQGSTAKMVVEAGLALALDAELLPKEGGILTPATAMGQVLIHRLEKNADMTFRYDADAP